MNSIVMKHQGQISVQSPPSQGALTNILQRLGYEVESAANGADAVAKYRTSIEQNRRFAVVLVDLTVPGGMGGVDAGSELLRVDPEAKIIASSGYADGPILANFREHGFILAGGKIAEVARQLGLSRSWASREAHVPDATAV